ncbi:transporter substrate-binding domain-containing protein, partial [bacterium]|nr:transporter substrate-binding domain-containing protein [bacterium]
MTRRAIRKPRLQRNDGRHAAAILIIWLLCLPVNAICGETIRVGIIEGDKTQVAERDNALRFIFSEILEEIASEEGWALSYVKGPRDSIVAWVESGRVDLVPAAPLIPELKNRLDFTRETVLSTWGQVYVTHGLKLRNMLDLNGRSIAMLEGDGFSEELRRSAERFNIKVSFIYANNYHKVLEAVDRGIADAGIVERTFGAMHEDMYKAGKTHLVFAPTEIRFAGNIEKEIDLLQTIDYYIAAFKRDRTSIYYRAIERYLGPGEDVA